MKNRYKHYIVLLLSMTLLLGACTKSGEIIDDNYPEPLIYWSGGSNQINVPASGYANYRIDTLSRQVYITLGIARSGLGNLAPFRVGLVPDPDTVNSLIQTGQLQNAIPLAPDAYTLPETVEVEEGREGAVFNLVLNMDELENIDREVLALGIRLDNPSLYEINAQQGTAVLLINYRGVVGISCPPDENMPGRIFNTYKTSDEMNTWDYGGFDARFEGTDRITITRNNDDGYGIAVKWSQEFNLDDFPIFAMRVYETPENGIWYLKFYDGSSDRVIRPENGTYKDLPDGSRIYYWNFPEETGLQGPVESNIQVVVEGARDQSLSYGWIKTFAEEEIVVQCIDE